MAIYGSYEEAKNAETLKNINLQNQELEKRIKLEETLNILGTLAIMGIILSFVVTILAITGMISLADILFPNL